MKVRKWEYKDILRISQIETECFPNEPWSFKMLASSFDTDSFHGVLAEDGGEIIGYGGITEAYRHSGVGTAIIEELLRTAASLGAKKVFLEVRVSNSIAMELYLKSGFKGAYARTRYYSDGEDCLVMVKEL